MPVYQVVTSGVDLDQDQRDRLAKGITAIHHDETQAPEPFVRVVFQPAPLGVIYTAGVVERSLVLACGIRAGRSDATRRQLLRRCYELVVDVTGLPPDQIVLAVQETPSGWLMEAGMFMPEANPEDEAAWMAKLRELIPGKYDHY